uniref:Uncharacterized protein n=1 Tax=Capra hircus TaxID=9925 RepID=A0A8C2S7P7_CAPHI
MKNPNVSLPVSPHDDLASSSHEDLHYSSCHDHLHSSSQETTPRLVNYKVFQNEVNSRKLKVFFRDFQHNDDFEDQCKDEAESENDGTLRKTSGFFLKQKLSSEDEELAGPSHPEIPTLQVQHHEYSGPNERTTSWNDPNKGAVYVLLNCA